MIKKPSQKKDSLDQRTEELARALLTELNGCIQERLGGGALQFLVVRKDTAEWRKYEKSAFDYVKETYQRAGMELQIYVLPVNNGDAPYSFTFFHDGSYDFDAKWKKEFGTPFYPKRSKEFGHTGVYPRSVGYPRGSNSTGLI